MEAVVPDRYRKALDPQAGEYLLYRCDPDPGKRQGRSAAGKGYCETDLRVANGLKGQVLYFDVYQNTRPDPPSIGGTFFASLAVLALSEAKNASTALSRIHRFMVGQQA